MSNKSVDGKIGLSRKIMYMLNNFLVIVSPITYLNPEFLQSSDDCRMAGGWWSDDHRTIVGGAIVVSGAEKKNIWSRRPRLAASIKCDEPPFKGGSGGALPPQAKIGGSGGQRPPAKNENENDKSI